MAIDGSLAKRIKKYAYKNHGIKLNDDIVSKIGNIASEYSLKPVPHYFDIVDEFDWNNGDFGDEGSCFWSCNTHMRTGMSKDQRFQAIRFFREEDKFSKYSGKFYENYRGIARAWLRKTLLAREIKKGVMLESEAYVLFNGYGLTTFKQADILAAYTEMSYVPVSLRNKENIHGGLYFNGDGFLFGNPEVIKHFKVIDISENINVSKT